METLTILFIAVGLAMDAFAVSITSGFEMKRYDLNETLRIAVSFGFFQFLMPVLGWSAGVGIRAFISSVDHWVAFGLLGAIGGKMLFESMGPGRRAGRAMDRRKLLALSLATSIDALAVGMSLSLLNIFIITPAIFIGIVTFLLSLLGVLIGHKFGHFFENKARFAGGLILIGIGLKILIEHTA